ncbi:MAG: 50S ribosomal protein L29 [Desulfobulbaceae bacterium]|uniref:Large ribosomal subunit protein uL29 n=1 Tax=Candidatus Desulfobia pelagia TaxID=2841692 RepID=A0A8J6TGA0_9BACT|nr:50S ribosomal protein L29 [Candidatus Desulfobia pelagia]
MKVQELREKSIEDLQGTASDISEELCKLRFQHGIRPLENTARLTELKRDIARIKTVISEKKKTN